MSDRSNREFRDAARIEVPFRDEWVGNLAGGLDVS